MGRSLRPIAAVGCVPLSSRVRVAAEVRRVTAADTSSRAAGPRVRGSGGEGDVVVEVDLGLLGDPPAQMLGRGDVRLVHAVGPLVIVGWDRAEEDP